MYVHMTVPADARGTGSPEAAIAVEINLEPLS